VSEFVPYENTERLKAWFDEYMSVQWQQMLDGSTFCRNVEGWDEFEDNASGQKFYWNRVRWQPSAAACEVVKAVWPVRQSVSDEERGVVGQTRGSVGT
jgi:hypothetical protein